MNKRQRKKASQRYIIGSDIGKDDSTFVAMRILKPRSCGFSTSLFPPGIYLVRGKTGLGYCPTYADWLKENPASPEGEAGQPQNGGVPPNR